jgi:nucleotide-binding universal stress UspA family protein
LRCAATKVVADHSAAKAVDRVEAVMGPDPSAKLIAACRYHHADALLIGRQAASDREAIVRLGRVARRLIRELPVAVAVVPPDYDPQPTDVGPIVVATDLSEDSVAAARYGLQLARELSVDLKLVHVRHGSEYVLAPPPDEDVDESHIEMWMRQYGLGGAESVIEHGDPVNRVLSVAHRTDASLIVCGSRHLSKVQRVFQASTGTDLARFSGRPVVVVPPESIDHVVG